jgi:hypothetical protein
MTYHHVTRGLELSCSCLKKGRLAFCGTSEPNWLLIAQCGVRFRLLDQLAADPLHFLTSTPALVVSAQGSITFGLEGADFYYLVIKVLFALNAATYPSTYAESRPRHMYV